MIYCRRLIKSAPIRPASCIVLGPNRGERGGDHRMCSQRESYEDPDR